MDDVGGGSLVAVDVVGWDQLKPGELPKSSVDEWIRTLGAAGRRWTPVGCVSCVLPMGISTDHLGTWSGPKTSKMTSLSEP